MPLTYKTAVTFGAAIWSGRKEGEGVCPKRPLEEVNMSTAPNVKVM